MNSTNYEMPSRYILEIKINALCAEYLEHPVKIPVSRFETEQLDRALQKYQEMIDLKKEAAVIQCQYSTDEWTCITVWPSKSTKAQILDLQRHDDLLAKANSIWLTPMSLF